MTEALTRPKVLRVVAVALLAFVGACRQDPEVIPLGALLPLSGPEAAYGEFGRNGIALAVSEINARGGVRGARLHVEYEDSQSSASEASSAYLKLLGKDRVRATLATGDPAVVTSASIANSEKSVLLNCGAASATLRGFDSFVFSGIADGNQEAEAMARFVVSRLHLKDVATVGLESEFHSAAMKEPDLEQVSVFARALTGLGGRVVADIRIPREKDDFHAQIEALKARRPAAVYYVGPVREALLLLRQAAHAGVHTQWLSDASFQTGELFDAPELEGPIYTYPHFSAGASARSKQFADAYRTRFGLDPEVYAATFYDGVYALAHAMEAAGGSSKDQIARGLRMAPFDGVAGPLDFTRASWVRKPLEFRTIRRGIVATLEVATLEGVEGVER